MTADEPVFLDVEDILEIHSAQLEAYGGGAGLRDRGLLESAIAQPPASFGGEFAHDGLYAMAAAYLFHIVQNHPFVDGNKRVGLDADAVHVEEDDGREHHPSDALYELTMGVAEGRIQRAAIAAELERVAKAKP